MQARYYDPVIGRFYSNDPVGFTGEVDTFNRYSYVGNNPYKYTDPDGRVRRLAFRFLKEPVRTAKTSYRSFKKFLQRHGVIAPTPQPVRNESDIPESDVPKSEGALPKPPTGPGSVPKEKRDKKRFFTPDERAKKREEQGNKCANGCGTEIDGSNSAGHHIDRHADGGLTIPENHAEVCTDCHKDLHSKKKD